MIDPFSHIQFADDHASTVRKQCICSAYIDIKDRYTMLLEDTMYNAIKDLSTAVQSCSVTFDAATWMVFSITDSLFGNEKYTRLESIAIYRRLTSFIYTLRHSDMISGNRKVSQAELIAAAKVVYYEIEFAIENENDIGDDTLNKLKEAAKYAEGSI